MSKATLARWMSGDKDRVYVNNSGIQYGEKLYFYNLPCNVGLDKPIDRLMLGGYSSTRSYLWTQYMNDGGNSLLCEALDITPDEAAKLSYVELVSRL